jgi:glycine betaine/proline transport system substrate-binding protein
MKSLFSRRSAVVTVVIAAALVLSGCSKSVNDSAGGASGDCGSYAIAMHAWGGYTASAQVVAEVAKKELGCTITQTTLDEGPTTYDAMEAGTIDVVIEDWGGGRWKEWTDRGAVVEAGLNGNVGLIGMYVAPWMAEKYPDITDSKNLNKYADLFKTADSGGKGAWFEGPAGYTTIGEKMVAANKLNFKVIFSGSAWQPWTLFAKIPNMESGHVKFPANDWSDPAKASGLTDYPESPLVKLISKNLNDANDAFTSLVKNFKWTNDDQNGVAADIEGGMTPEAAAQKWIDAHADVVKSWLGK